ncbi:MAG: ABC transporter permease, partial [Acidimicrobiia bacterium]|nr:ABC transporter permease [Acidimicrobiia bacterium]
MTSWRAIGLVWRREVTERIRSKVFMIGTAATLLIITAIFVIPQLVNPGPDEVSIGVIGADSAPIIATARLLAGPDDSIELKVLEYDDMAGAEAAVEDGTIEALLIDGTDLVTLGQGSFSSNVGSELLQEAAAANAVEQLVAETGMTSEQVIELMTGELLETRTLSGVSADDPTREIVAYAGLMLMYMAILMYGTWTLAGVTEEKSNRVVEILVSTIQPWQLLTGKVTGIGTLAIGQFALTVGYGLALSRLTGSVDLADVPLDSAAMVILWF